MAQSKTDYSALNGATEAVAVPVAGGDAKIPSQVEVVAPADLAGGYEFTVDVGGIATRIRVPDGGVKQGQTFTAAVVHQEGAVGAGAHNIPRGAWRDGICSCFANGVCHPMLCLACWCQPCALGQVMTRFNLDVYGKKNDKELDSSASSTYWTAFKVLFVVFAVYMAIDEFFSIILDPYVAIDLDENGDVQQKDVPGWAVFLLAVRSLYRVLFFIYILYLIIRTRSHIRSRYAIPEGKCQGCEDCCCAFWLPCCTITQMARHTADYDTYQAACCSDTGLPEQAPAIV